MNMTEEDEGWLKDAMSDDALVADMLLRLKQAETRPTPIVKTSPALQLEWSVRQRRSRQVVRKKGELTRASPTTPLSWSGATTSSGGAGPSAVDGFEESSKPSRHVDNPRSKLVGTSETTTTKKPRKKKTLAELREEEDFLLKERGNLKNQLASLRVNFEEQRATNETLKKIKLDIVPHQTMETVGASPATREAISNQPLQMEVDRDPTCVVMATNAVSNELNPSVSKTCSKIQEDESRTSSFMLPDLNLPLDDNSGLYRVS
ncbi:hypothetical protein LWI28_025329 [Acer negundo]|uniref:Uncharacterized protein n=1 Tax=Acer negundo TaxID=4023 RepID=A0AAD5JH47_ACENE|nr:hypothetical protein LWI28_025329 [Acer negundo]KAK4858421.1 hypothetical protein QYF36_016088 [Acer negundo]